MGSKGDIQIQGLLFWMVSVSRKVYEMLLTEI